MTDLEMKEASQFLRKIPTFAQLEEGKIASVAQHLMLKRYRRGDLILRHGVGCDFIGIVKSGRIRFTRRTQQSDRTVREFGPGAYFGSYSLLAGKCQKSPVDIWAISASVELWILSRSELAKFKVFRQTTGYARGARGAERNPADVARAGRPTARLFNILAATLILVILTLVAFRVPPLKVGLAKLHCALGYCYLNQDVVEKASGQFRKALSLDEEHARAYAALGYIAYQQGAEQRARQYLEKALQLDHECSEAHHNLGVICVGNREPQLALEHLLKAAKLDPDNAVVYAALGLTYQLAGDQLNAGRYYREALRIDPSLVFAHHNLGVVFYQQGALPDAALEFRQALQRKPSLADSRVGLGAIYFQQGEYAQAIREFEEAIRLDSGDHVAFFYLALVYETIDRTDEAIAAFKRAWELAPDEDTQALIETYLISKLD